MMYSAPRTGVKRKEYGLYSPPAYLFDETESNYDKFLVNGPVKSLADTEHGMDGTVKHFVTFQNSSERVCDYIEDRYGNRWRLSGFLERQCASVVAILIASRTPVFSNPNPQETRPERDSWRLQLRPPQRPQH
jgi:hypothetical protein